MTSLRRRDMRIVAGGGAPRRVAVLGVGRRSVVVVGSLRRREMFGDVFLTARESWRRNTLWPPRNCFWTGVSVRNVVCFVVNLREEKL